jgi:phosphoribosylpyrophosphate synthetase
MGLPSRQEFCLLIETICAQTSNKIPPVLPSTISCRFPSTATRQQTELLPTNRTLANHHSYLCCHVLLLLPARHGPHEEEEVVYERLPSDIASRQVLLMDPLVGTGRTACRAVEVRGGVMQQGNNTRSSV